MPAPTFVALTGLVDGFRPHAVWINPERVAYLQERVRYGRDNGPLPAGTRVFFAEDGVLDVQETPDVVVDLFAGSPFICTLCHGRRDPLDIANDICPTCEAARADLQEVRS
jgi:hypothetical protein